MEAAGGIVALILLGVAFLVAIGALVCYVITLVHMFKNGDTVLGVIGIVGFFVCGLGVLFTYIMGWVKSGEYQNQKVMLAWTVCIVISLLIRGGVALLANAQ